MSWDSKPELSEINTDFDWSEPVCNLTVKTDDLDLRWDNSEPDSDDSDDGISMNIGNRTEEEKDSEEKNEDLLKEEQIDIMAQQLKFVACLKILMEELSTLATGFEVDGILFVISSIS